MLILASKSPRRAEILTQTGFEFRVRAADVDEARLDREAPDAYVRRLAAEKARAVAMHGGEIVLGADTVVVIGEEVLGKPSGAAEAARMLRLLSGAEHAVITGICLRTTEREVADSAATRVRFSAMSESEIEAYVASGEPMDKAGAYAIQGLAARYIERIDGCYFNVVGLPVSLVYRTLNSISR